MFIHECSVKLHQTDAAGLLFFGHQLTICHDTYELFMESIGEPFATILNERGYLLAIVHAEADYKRKLYVGDRLRVELTVAKVGESSYTLAYAIYDSTNNLAGTASTVHVCVDKKSGQSIPLPNSLKRHLIGHG